MASDTATDYDVLKHLLEWLSTEENYCPSYCVYLRPTTPLRDPRRVDEAIDFFMNQDDASALRSIHKMSETAYKMVELDNGFLEPLPIDDLTLEKINAGRQAFPETYHPNGYVDIFRSDVILNQKKLFEDRVVGWVTDPASEIDCLSDLEFLEFQMTSQDQEIRRLFS